MIGSARPGNEVRLIKRFTYESFVPSLIPTGKRIDSELAHLSRIARTESWVRGPREVTSD